MAVQHKYFKRGPKMSELTPDYLGERKQNSTDPQQRAEYQEFKMKLNAVQGKA